ncbi:DNA cytosine methyltransferase [Candidatus Marsarchaeota archaeon]|nr:DNA cytosine methyltransferase [Candidatus Marsarchaeota archaeon]MCL5122866.1 DNA cytosine methyltransferase [Candidatus Marsarchaeota archaeon]
MTDNPNRRAGNVVDLFCGAGGLSKGFELAGYRIIAGLDFDKTSVETFGFNFPDAVSICADIKSIRPEQFLERLKEKKVDVVVGGPPCQGFSTANRQQKFIDDPRNILYKYFVEYVSFIKPEIFVMENVAGMEKKVNEIEKDFSDIGYLVGYGIMNASEYGIPQNRKRLFFIGIKDSDGHGFKTLNNIFSVLESEKSGKIVPLKDALWGLRKITPIAKKNATYTESNTHGLTEDTIQADTEPPEYILKINHGSAPKAVYNHKARYNNERDIEIFRRLPQGGKSDHPSIQDIMPYKRRSNIFKDKFYKLIADRPCKTITSHMKFDCNMYIHPFQNRGLTPREAARVQSFPDSYRFIGSLSNWYSQIGNAVPPQLAFAIAAAVRTVAAKGKIHIKDLV